ncbi:DUF485 domain-containing protein [Ectobacillus sp. JY-23]|uniref:DUF485 domain-containing protein n=1 Tax=Ectobacillus sp. JY-23 TaxID=2933872 RepID=UPI001FF2AE6C|nr:DUF485 domain-containing protein [Ectobacillus sp. JY-23]UOY93402.1 DUF485 domain-containing protein [Ectobacillus sp. JY-23]
MNQHAKQIKKEVNYTAVANSADFQRLLQAKKRFIIPMSLFFFCFYIALPLMTSYSKILNTSALGDITWAWVFAFAQFIMTWALCMIYSKKATSFDKMSDRILASLEKGRE